MSVALLGWHQAIPVVVERTLNGVAVGMAVALVAGLLLRLTPKTNSGTRFAAWFAVLMAVAVLPFCNVAALKPGMSGARASGELGGGGASVFTLPTVWSEGLFTFWAVMACAGLARIGVGLWHVRRLRRSSEPVDFAAHGLESLEADFAAASVTLGTSDQVKVPAAIGFFRPMVIVPAWTLTELSATELNAVLLHELAHLKRRDGWTNLAQKLVRAVFFFHPALWWVDRQLSLEREMACDDLVLAQAPDQRAYAKCLVTLAEKSVLRRGFALAQTAVRGLRQTSARVAQILDVNRSPATSVSKPAMGAVAVVAVASVIALPHVPRLLAFEDARAAVVATSSGVTATPEVAAVMAKATSNVLGSAPKRPTTSRSFAGLAAQARLRAGQDDKTVKVSGLTKMPAPAQPAPIVAAAGKGTNSVVPLGANQKGLSPCGAPTECGEVTSADAVTASALDNARPSLVMANASSAEWIEERVTPQGVELVVQRQSVDAQGRMVWSLSVYRLTVFHPANAAAQVPAKKT
jgi:beta-lactamase regulating signal transducer with metallopeptidase domain